MEWILSSTKPKQEEMENFNYVINEINELETDPKRLEIREYYNLFFINYKKDEQIYTFNVIYPQSYGALKRYTINTTIKHPLLYRIKKDLNYTNRVDKLVYLSYLNIEKMFITETIEKLEMYKTIVNDEIKDIEDKYIYPEIVNIPDIIPIISYPIRKYNAHGYKIISYGWPKFNKKLLTFTIGSFFWFIIK